MKVTPTHDLFRGAMCAFRHAALPAAILVCSRVTAQAAIQGQPGGNGVLDLFVSYYGITFLCVLMLVGALIYRYRKSAQAKDIFTAKAPHADAKPAEGSAAHSSRKHPAPAGSAEHERAQAARSAQGQPEATAGEEPSAFGAYRIDQEVGKLILGKPHRMDVMSSRVPDDRRAIEASLIKALGAPETEDEGRERARQALEEYGFVARQSAVMLQGRDAWERSSAARVLGQIGSGSSLPALVEALHDADSVVRNQAVTSLGQLKQPAAIGALLDISRRHPDIPPALLSESLSACSVDSLGYLDSASFDLSTGGGAQNEPQGFGSSLSFEELPTGDEEEALPGLLTRLESADPIERSQVAREMGLYPVQRSVSALCHTALHDADSSVRAAAVSALGSIDHESVFAPVLISLADETREVRAAAARTLSSLHFDRTIAYRRVIETADEQTLQEFAHACVKTGIVSQSVDRLASEDRRQAHEAFTLLSVLAKAGELQPIVEVIQNHRDVEGSLAAVRVLSMSGRADAAAKLRELVDAEGISEDVRTSILEVLYKLDNEAAVV
jgi:HEAT repeat protein